MTISYYGRIAVAASCAVVLAMPAVAIAQEAEEDTGPNFILVRSVTVNADGNAEWVALQEQLVAAQKEANSGHRTVYQQVRGSLETYHIVSTHDDRGGFDEQGNGLDGLREAPADWVDAIVNTISSRRLVEARIHKDLTISRDEESERNLIVVRRISVKQGQDDEFHSWLADELRPALIAGGATGVTFSHTTHGGDQNICTIGTQVANWAEFDGDGAFSHMSEGEIAGLFANWDDMVEGHEVIVGAYRADLSY